MGVFKNMAIERDFVAGIVKDAQADKRSLDKTVEAIEAIEGVRSSINHLSQTLPKFDYFIEALDELHHTLQKINLMWEEDKEVEYMDEIENQQQKWGEEKSYIF